LCAGRVAGVRISLEKRRADICCWLKTPGKCSQRDDMDVLLPALAQSDVWVFATPVYWSGISGPLKNAIDRLLPLVLPSCGVRDGHCRKPLREGVVAGKVVRMSSCRFWERQP
jgi:multimeric flavodoxin WrbA